MSERDDSRDSHGKPELEVLPQLPTSRQILGTLVKSLGVNDPRLQPRTDRRYFSGHLQDRVKDSSRDEIIEASSDALSELGFGLPTHSASEPSSASAEVAKALCWHAAWWDQFRAFLKPRMLRVYPRHLPDVWQTYSRLAAIDMAVRVAAHLHLTGASPTTLDFLDWASVNRRADYLNRMRGDAGVSLNRFAESVGANDNSVEARLYHGLRPSDQNLAREPLNN